MICDSCKYQNANSPMCDKQHIPLSLEFVGKCKDYKWRDKERDMSNVDHPEYYNRGIECIDEMIAVFGVEVVKHFCLCNVWKYRYRASDKNGKEDLDKSDWYIKKYMELSGAPIKIREK